MKSKITLAAICAAMILAVSGCSDDADIYYSENTETFEILGSETDYFSDDTEIITDRGFGSNMTLDANGKLIISNNQQEYSRVRTNGRGWQLDDFCLSLRHRS